jgi:uncharacterized OsmC-like protein
MEVLVKYDNGYRFTATCKGYIVTTGRGNDGNKQRDGMWPAQLFSASIGMCIGGYIAEYCKKQGIAFDDMTIELARRVQPCSANNNAPKRTRTSRIDATIRLDAELSEEQRQGILEAADRCHITDSIKEGMKIVCSLAPKQQ